MQPESESEPHQHLNGSSGWTCAVVAPRGVLTAVILRFNMWDSATPTKRIGSYSGASRSGVRKKTKATIMHARTKKIGTESTFRLDRICILYLFHADFG